MKTLKFYEWIAGNMSDFTRPFQNDENLANQAKNFWRSLENFSIVSVLIFILVAVVGVIIYYKPFNNSPGRHYHPKYWLIFWAISLIFSFVVTLGLEYFFCEPKLNGALLLETKIALCNAIYTALLYLLISIIWCNFFPTNAYRFFKK